MSPSLSDQFRKALVSRGRSEATVRSYLSDLSEFVAWAGEEPRADTFDGLVTDWLNAGRVGYPGKAPWSPKTTGRRVTSMRTFAKVMRWSAHALNDYRAPTPARPVPHPIIEGMDGVKRMLVFANADTHRALIALCALGGLRCNEARTLPPNAVDRKDMTITIMGKGSKQRIIPMSDDLWALIRPAWQCAQATGRPTIVGLCDRQARQAITATARRAGLANHVSSHDLRATFGTAVYAKTRDLRVTQELLGHASSQQTEVYTDVPMDRQREAVKL